MSHGRYIPSVGFLYSNGGPGRRRMGSPHDFRRLSGGARLLLYLRRRRAGAGGAHYVARMRMIRKIMWLTAWLLSSSLAQAQTDVLASRYDNARTGQNLSETTLSSANVN